MPGAGAIFILVDGDISGLEKALKKAQKTTQDSSKKMEKSFTNVSKAVNQLRTAVVALGGVWALRELARVADAYTLLDSKLKLVTSSTDEATKTFNRLYEISQDTGVSFRNTADTFVNMQLNVKDVGVSIEDTLRVLETFNKALIINGSTQREATSATLQFKQALASGRLAGEEFRGVSEGNAYWMTQLAHATGMTVGELRTLSHQQLLTREVIIDASKDMHAAVTKDFGGITKTLGRAFNEIGNAIEVAFADANKASKGTESLAISVSGLATTITENQDTISNVFETIIDDIPVTSGGIKTVGEDLLRLVGILDDIVRLSKSVGGPDALEMGLIGYVLWKSGPVMAGVIAGVITLNEQLKHFNLNIGNLKDSSEGVAENFSNIWDVITGERDANTGLFSDSQLTNLVKTVDELERIAKFDDTSVVELSSHFDDIAESVDATNTKFRVTENNLKEWKEATDQPLGKDSWLIQVEDQVEIDKQVLKDAETAAEEAAEAADKSAKYLNTLNVLMAEQLPKDSWLIQFEDQADVDARAAEALKQQLDETYRDIDLDLTEFFGPIDKATEDFVKNQERLKAASDQLWQDFVTDTGNIIEDFIGTTLKGEFDSIEDMFKGLLDSMLDMLVSFIAKAAANSLLSAIFGGTALGAGDFTLSTLLGIGGGTAAAGTGVLTGTAAAASVGVGVGAPIAAGSAIPVTIVGSEGVATLGGAAGADLLGVGAATAGTGVGLLAGAGVGAFVLAELFQGSGPTLSEQLNESLVQPFQIAATGVTDEFQEVTESMVNLIPEFNKFDSVSLDMANNMLVLGTNLAGATTNADGLTETMITQIQVYNEATGAWERQNVSVSDMILRMDELRATTDMSVEAIAQMVAEEQGLISITDELISSYNEQKETIAELAEVSDLAAEAFRDAGGDISAALRELDSLPSDAQGSYEVMQAEEALRDVPRYASGTPYVPHDQLAFLHKGERVMTSRENEEYSHNGPGTKDILAALATYTKKTSDILKRIEKTGLPTSSRTGVLG